MTLSKHALQLIGASDYFSHFKPDNLQGMLMWINDSDLRVVDLTPAYAKMFLLRREDIIGRHSRELLTPEAASLSATEHEQIRRLQKPCTATLWMELPVGWRKVITTRTPLDSHYVIGVAQDITEQGLLNEWLLNLELESGKLPLGAHYRNEELTWAELIVLHRISRSRPYNIIAAELHISPATVRYRINRIKEKFGVETIDEMWEEIFVSGLVHILSLPLEPKRTTLTRQDLLRLDPTTTVPPRRARVQPLKQQD